MDVRDDWSDYARLKKDLRASMTKVLDGLQPLRLADELSDAMTETVDRLELL